MRQTLEGFVLVGLLALVTMWGASQAQVPAKQTMIIVNVSKVKADTFVIDQAPALLILNLGRDTTTAYRGAHLLCGYSYVIRGAQPFSFAVRWAGDSLRAVVGTWRPLCQP